MPIEGRVTSNLRAADAPPLNRSLEIQWWITKAWPHFPPMALSGVPDAPAQLCHSDEQSAATFLHQRIMWLEIPSEFNCTDVPNRNYIGVFNIEAPVFKLRYLESGTSRICRWNKRLNNELLLLIRVIICIAQEIDS